MEKIDLKKKYKEIYKVKKESIVSFPEMKYISIKGEGSPSSDLFIKSIQALYPIAYTISMSYNSDFNIDNFHKFVVSPLEGVWDLIDVSIGFNGNKDNLKWTLMILMPDFVTDVVFKEAQKRAFKKTKHSLINEVSLITIKPHKCCISLHIGSYDDEIYTFDKMQDYVNSLALERACMTHREIYLSDFRKTEVSKLKTVLCFDIK